MEFGAPGVKKIGRTDLTAASVPGEVRALRTLALVVGRYHRLKVYCVLVTTGKVSCQIERKVTDPPAAVATRCKLPLPEWLMLVLMLEPALLVDTFHGPLKSDSKSPFTTKLGPTSGWLPAAR